VLWVSILSLHLHFKKTYSLKDEPNKSIIISNIYHSPNPPPNITPSHTYGGDFLETLDGHLDELSNTNKDCYLFLDANIDLPKLNEQELSSDYMNVNVSNGFVQLICLILNHAIYPLGTIILCPFNVQKKS
jgi:hypothetical protein